MSSFETFADRCRAERPSVFVVLGSGLGVVGQRVARIEEVGFAEIPGLPASTVHGHRGMWTLGRWAGKTVIVSEGRLHFYEGHPWEVVTRPIVMAAALGCRVALLTNAAGGIRDDLTPGALMPLADHLEWNHPNPWQEPAHPSPYAPELTRLVVRCGPSLVPGVYAAVTGPSYETPAEIRALRAAGADAVGMSTSREALAAVRCGMACAAVSMVTNRAAGLSTERLSHHEVMATGKASAAKLADLLEAVIGALDR